METAQQELLTLDDNYPVTKDQVDAFARTGHILLRHVASREEIDAYRPIIQQVVRQSAVAKNSQGRIEDYSSLFLQVTNVWRIHEALRRFVFARRFARIAAELLGVSAVRLYHDQALFKPADGKPTPWHQDQFYWPLDTSRTITMWMPLMDVSRDMGTMIFATGSHRLGSLVKASISEESSKKYEEILLERKLPLWSYALNAGDATFHAGWTVHRSHPNRSGSVREVMTIIYYADGAKILEPDNEFRVADMNVFHPGQKPGEPAASPLNPILYEANAG